MGFYTLLKKGKIKLMKTNIKKQVLFFSAVLFSISLGIIIPLHFSHAFGFECIGMYVGSWIIAGGLQVVLAVSSLIVGLAGMILSWVLSPYFMSMPYTSGGVVEIGWPIVRDFINMFFVLGLVVIGLATALRLKEYQAQKALPVLIIIAILINFTPVICGVIVDASNILMNFFLEEISGFGTMVNLFSSQGAMLAQTITADSFSQLAALPFTIIGKTLIMIIFAWVTAFIFFMYSMLFIMRYVMIWVLVIVSPIAFFSRIFPATKKGEYVFKSILGWDEWWKQFFEWTLIGVTGAFFLYLGEQIMNGFSISTAGWLQGIPPEGGGWVIDIITAPIIEFMNTMLSWGVVLAFLFIGWMVAIETKALGAKHITDTFKKAGKAMGIAGVKLAPAIMGGMAGGAGKGFQAGTGLSGKYDIKGKGLLGKTRGKLGGAAAGILTGGFTKKGQEEGVDWAKKRIVPPGSVIEKVYGGLKESLVGEVGGAGWDATKNEWFRKTKTRKLKPEEIEAGEIELPEEKTEEVSFAAPMTPEKKEITKLKEELEGGKPTEEIEEEEKEGYTKGKGITKTPKKRIKKYLTKRKIEKSTEKIIKENEKRKESEKEDEEDNKEGYNPKKSTGFRGR